MGGISFIALEPPHPRHLVAWPRIPYPGGGGGGVLDPRLKAVSRLVYLVFHLLTCLELYEGVQSCPDSILRV